MAPVLVAEHGVEEWRGGIGGRGGAHHVRLSELSVKFLSQNVRGLSPAKEQELVAGMVIKGAFAATVQETWRTGRAMEVTRVDWLCFTKVSRVGFFDVGYFVLQLLSPF